MSGLGHILDDLFEVRAHDRGILRLAAVDDLLLESGVDLGPGQVGRRAAHRGDRLAPHGGAGRADAQALEVRGRLDRLVREEMAGSLEPVEREDLVAERFELRRPVLRKVRGRDLPRLFVVVRDIGRAEDSDFLHEARHPARVRDDRDIGAHLRLLLEVVGSAELGARIDLDLESAARLLLDGLLERHGPLEHRILVRNDHADAEDELIGGQRAGREQRSETQSDAQCYSGGSSHSNPALPFVIV